MSTELESLIERLTPTCQSALQKAAELCVTHTHYNVELEHFLLELIRNEEDQGIQTILKRYHISTDMAVSQLLESIDQLKRGNSRTPAISQQIFRLLEESWMFASIHLKQTQIGSASIMLAMLSNKILHSFLVDSAPIFEKANPADLEEHLKQFIAMEGTSPDYTPGGEFSEQPAGQQGYIDQYTVDVTENVRLGKVDPIEGRDREIRQVIDILTRRQQNNPILTGDAGVGKTAVVEGFTIRVVNGEVPDSLKNVAVKAMDLGLLQAGAGMKGEFEERLKKIIEEIKSSPHPIILFIDEAHTLIGAGGQAGQNDAANLLKPALARGELRTIAATTWAEYKKYFEKDHALVRRFQVVGVEEPSPESAVRMLRYVAPPLEEHHNVRIMDEALQAAVKLSHRYITGRKLPDKAISLLDTACARVSLGQATYPPEIEDLFRQLDRIEHELKILKREAITQPEHAEKIGELESQIDNITDEYEKRQKQWEEEKELVHSYLDIRKQLEKTQLPDTAKELIEESNVGETKETTSKEASKAASSQEPETEETNESPGSPSLSKEEIKENLSKLKAQLDEIQGDTPMVQTDVDVDVVASVVSDWTGIPLGKMMTDEVKTILNLQNVMGERIIGQDHGLKAISKRIRTSRAQLDDPGKPTAVFMLVGPSGVGKTETALTLADTLYGGEDKVVTINMSEYQEAHTVSSLKGAPPGYVGYGSGGILTEAVRRQPFSVVLLDEIEKAHTDVTEIFYQVFDKGIIEDGEGVKVNFRDTIIIMTSNIGTDTITEMCENGKKRPSPEEIAEAIRPELVRHFKPAFLGRAVIVPYYPLNDDNIQNIVKLKLDKIVKRFKEQNKGELIFNPKLYKEIANRCTEVDSGARNIDHILTHTLLPELSERLLKVILEDRDFKKINVSLDKKGKFVCRFS